MCRTTSAGNLEARAAAETRAALLDERGYALDGPNAFIKASLACASCAEEPHECGFAIRFTAGAAAGSCPFAALSFGESSPPMADDDLYSFSYTRACSPCTHISGGHCCAYGAAAGAGASLLGTLPKQKQRSNRAKSALEPDPALTAAISFPSQ